METNQRSIVPPKSLAVRAALALILMIGFYFFALVISGSLLFIPYATWTYAHSFPVKLVLACVVGAGVILWSIVPRIDRFVPPGPRIDPYRQPRLYEVLEAVAKITEQQMPHEAYLVSDFNAWVSQRGGVMGFGSRRVMGIGLPLLQVLTVSQVQAVLAHEFGHYHGGDTNLGPWIYKTRSAIVRTILGLGQQNSFLQKPFIWYGKMFLRITHAISRQQEFLADQLAATKIGSRPLIEGLQATHREGMVFESFWSGEVAPLLLKGFRPPITDGFNRFITSSSIRQAISKNIERELNEGRSDPFDSHPALRERIAAVTHLPPGEAPLDDTLAFSLLTDVPGLETELLSALFNQDRVQALKPIKWGDVGEQVYLPFWRQLIELHKAKLEGMTLGSLSHWSTRMDELGDKFGDPPDEFLTPEERVRRADAILGAATAVVLCMHGWTLHTEPGELYCQLGQAKIEPFASLHKLASGEITTEAWQSLCESAAITDVDLACAGPRRASQSTEP